MEALGTSAGSVAVGLGQGPGCREWGVQVAGAGPAEQRLWQVGTWSWEEVFQDGGFAAEAEEPREGKQRPFLEQMGRR